MVRLVPLENDVIPMILPRNMHLIKGSWIILSCGVAGHRAIPMDHWSVLSGYKAARRSQVSNHEMSLFCLCPHVNKVD